MNKLQKEKWLKALRSGEFKQGQGLLYSHLADKYCCLGVYCKVNNIESTRRGLIIGEDGTYIELTKEVQYQLANLNDSIPPHSFEMLADYIEANIQPDN